MNSKLKPEAWIHEALLALAEGGMASVKVEVLARRLKVTKGSFYWHFKNRSDLLAQVLAFWCEGRIQIIQRQVSSQQPARQTLNELLRLYMDHTNLRGNAIELAIRDWAHTDAQAADAVRQVDEQRLNSVAGLYSQFVDDQEDAYARAYLFYSYVFGSSLLNTASASINDSQLRKLCAALLIDQVSCGEEGGQGDVRNSNESA